MVHHPRIGLVLATIALTFAGSAMAAPAPHTRLVKCGTETCLLLSGHRADAAAPVSINDHVVAVSGGRSWRARLPLETVRAWSAPHARSIAVAVIRPDGSADKPVAASLPIGLLGHVTDLAALVVRAH